MMFEAFRNEIHYQGQIESGSFQIVQSLRLMNIRDSVAGFEFKDHGLLN